MNRIILLGSCALAVLLILGGCAAEIVEEPFEPIASHRDYLEAIERLDLHETALGSDWIVAADTALSNPIAVEVPFQETAVLDPQDPSALGYSFDVERGRALTVTIGTESDAYFADLYRVDGDERTIVASRPAGGSEIRFEPRRGGRYLLRIQPELLRGGRFAVAIVATASLGFPVEGGDPGDIWSFYGDGRDGGLRMHEGIDIFGPRGTRLLAASDSLVARVGQRDRGGNVVTLYDEERDLRLYYAHLEGQLVEEGQRVRAGDPIGTMGNTGNAITTPPHLHIGVYQGGWRGDVDPWNYFVDPPLTEPPPVEYESLVGSWVTLATDASLVASIDAPRVQPRWVNRNPLLRQVGAGDSPAERETGSDTRPSWDERASGPPPSRTDRADESPMDGRPGHLAARTPVWVAEIQAGSPVQVVGASRDYVRVVRPDLVGGFVPRSVVSSPAQTARIDSSLAVRDPWSGDEFARLDAGSTVVLVGSYTDARTGTEQLLLLLDTGRVGVVDAGLTSVRRDPQSSQQS